MKAKYLIKKCERIEPVAEAARLYQIGFGGTASERFPLAPYIQSGGCLFLPINLDPALRYDLAPANFSRIDAALIPKDLSLGTAIVTFEDRKIIAAALNVKAPVSLVGATAKM